MLEGWRPSRASLALLIDAVAATSLPLHDNRLRYVCAAVSHGHAYMPDHLDPESIARTATGRAGAITVSVHAADLPVGLPILLSRMASRIGTCLQQSEPLC